MHHLFTTLRFRLMLLVFLAVLPALGVILYSGLEHRRMAADEAQKDFMDLVIHASSYQERVVEGVRQMLFSLAELPAVRQQDGAVSSAVFARIMEKQKIYGNISAINLQGMPFASAIAQPPRSQLGRTHFDQAIKTRDFAIGEYGIGRASGKPTIHFAYPILDHGVVQGVVSASVILDYLNTLVAKTQMPPGSMLTVIDRSGTILARYPQEQWVGKRMPEAEIVKIVLAKEEGIAEAVGIDGVPCLFAFTPLGVGSHDLLVYAGVPLKTVYAEAHRILIRNLLALGLATVLALAGAWLFGSLLIMRGISALVGTTQRLAAGDLSVRTGWGQGEGEIHQLARSFDQMVDTLEQREAERQRAEAQLEKTNKYLENVFDESADCIGIVDDKGRFTQWNKAGLELYGYTLDEAIGKSAFDLYEDKTELKTMLAQLRRDGYVRNYEINMRCKDGRVTPFALSIKLLRDRDNKASGSVTVARNLSDTKQAMVESQAMNIRLQEEIGERKQAETKLQKTLGKLQATVAEVEQRNRDITRLNEIIDLLQSCLTRDEACSGIAKFVPQLFPGLSGTLYMLSPHKGLLMEAVANWGEVQNGMQIFTADKCWALRRGAVHLVKEASSNLLCQHLPEPFSAEYMCVPMIAQGEIIGLLYLQAPLQRPGDTPEEVVDYLTDRDERLAITVAKQISLALANLKLRETLQSQAIRDPLTGLYNRRYLEETMDRELHRARRQKTQLGVVMMDLDHFKDFNDTFGHAAGDALLSALATVLTAGIRAEDIACRYGGEEFLLIMPGSSLETTGERAENVRQAVQALQVKYQDRLLKSTTISLGVAIFPGHGSTGEEVIAAADAALYRAKQAGRDRVEIAVSSPPGAPAP